MLGNFSYSNPTRLYFGDDAIAFLGEELKNYGKKVMLTYGGDLIRVSAKDAYPEDYDDTVDRAKKEQDEDSRPEIDVDLTEEQIAGYDTVFFGFPVWWYDIPMPMYTFLDSYDFTGKTIIPFLSHEGSSNGGSAEQTINEHARGAAVRFEDALSIRGGKVDSSEQDVRDWVDGLGFGK